MSSLIIIVHIGTIIKIIKSNVYSKYMLVVKGAFVIFLPILLVLCTFAPLTLLPTIPTYSRFYLAFGVVVLFFGIEAEYVFSNRKIIFYALVSLIIFQSFSFIYMVGNASASQKEYETYLAYNIASDIEEIASVYEEKINKDDIVVSIVGQTPFAPETRMLIEKYPTLENYVPRYITNSGWLGGAWLNRYLIYPVEFTTLTQEVVQKLESLPSEKSNLIYNVYVYNNVIVLRYNNGI